MSTGPVGAEERLRRRWVLAPIGCPDRVGVDGIAIRTTSRADDKTIADVLIRAYAGAIDFDPSDDRHKELEVWRTLDGAQDDASAVAMAHDRSVGVCLIAVELGAPFLYEIAVVPERRRCGVAAQLLATSLRILEADGHDLIAAWVTCGNEPSEKLLDWAGFVPVAPPLDRAGALKHYRAATAREAVAGPALALATTVDAEGRATLWVVATDSQPETRVAVRDTTVTIITLTPDDQRLGGVARNGIPLAGAAWLLDRRRVPLD